MRIERRGRRTWAAWAGALAWLAAGALPARAAPSRDGVPRFSQRVEAAGGWVSLNVPAGARVAGLQNASIKTVRSRRSGEPRDGYPMWWLWTGAQLRGGWTDEAGNFITLMEVINLLPPARRHETISAEDYEDDSRTFAPAREHLLEWAATASDQTRKLERQPRVPASLRMAQLYAVGSYDTRGPGFMLFFQFPRTPILPDSDAIFALRFQFAGGDAEALAAAIERDVLPSLKPIAPKKADQAGASRRGSGSASSVAENDRSPEWKASRDAVLWGIRGKDNWWFEETRDFIVATDVPRNRASIVTQVKTDAQRLRDAFARLIPPVRPINAVSVIKIYGTSAGYLGYVGKQYGMTGGMWVPVKRELVIRPADGASLPQQRRWIKSVIYHESLHQYLYYAFMGHETPPWYNEGHATFMEGVEWDRMGTMTSGETGEYDRLLDKLVAEKAMQFQAFTRLSYEQFYGAKTEIGLAANYARAWALVYYLRKVAPLDPNAPGRDTLDRFYKAMMLTGNGELAGEAALDTMDWVALENAFAAFWKSPQRRMAARRYDLWATLPKTAPAASGEAEASSGAETTTSGGTGKPPSPPPPAPPAPQTPGNHPPSVAVTTPAKPPPSSPPPDTQPALPGTLTRRLDSRDFAWKYDQDVLSSGQDLDQNGMNDFWDKEAAKLPDLKDGVAVFAEEDLYRTDFHGSLTRLKLPQDSPCTVEAAIRIHPDSKEGPDGVAGVFLRDQQDLSCAVIYVGKSGVKVVIAADGSDAKTMSLGAFDNTDRMHVYRVARTAPAEGHLGQLWIWRDGTLLNPEKQPLSEVVITGASSLQVGDTGRPVQGAFDLDYLRLHGEAVAP